MKPKTYPNMDALIDDVASGIREKFAPEELADLMATIIVRMTFYYTVSLEDGSVTVRGTMCSDPDIYF